MTMNTHFIRLPFAGINDGRYYHDDSGKYVHVEGPTGPPAPPYVHVVGPEGGFGGNGGKGDGGGVGPGGPGGPKGPGGRILARSMFNKHFYYNLNPLLRPQGTQWTQRTPRPTWTTRTTW